MATEFGRRLRAARRFANLTQEQAARRTGISQSTISTAERQGYKSQDTAIYARVYGVNAIWLATGEGEMTHQAVQDAAALTQSDSWVIHQYNTGGKMGNGLILRDQPGIIHSWTVSSAWIRQNVHRITSPKNLAIVTGFGDSMRPLFNPGDPLLVDTGRERADVDGIYFFRVGEEGFIKRLQRIPTAGGLILRAKSENASYDPFDITPDMDFQVFGWVVKVWCGMNF